MTVRCTPRAIAWMTGLAWLASVGLVATFGEIQASAGAVLLGALLVVPAPPLFHMFRARLVLVGDELIWRNWRTARTLHLQQPPTFVRLWAGWNFFRIVDAVGEPLGWFTCLNKNGLQDIVSAAEIPVVDRAGRPLRYQQGDFRPPVQA